MRRVISLLCVVFAFFSSPADEPAPQPQPQSVTLAAVGDNLIHDVIYQQAYTNGKYDFKPLYSRVERLISDFDIAFINQETPMHPGRPLSNYPNFNTPIEMAANLAELGFDVVGFSNNHVFDMGIDGFSETMNLINNTEGLLLTGAWKDKAAQEQIPLIEKNGITLAFLAFAEYTNLPRPAGAADMLCYTNERENVSRLVNLARDSADVVVVSVHWGNENTTSPTAAQREFAAFLAGLNVDVVLGTHPHVLQPLERLTKSDGGEMLVYYSLGNFISAQAGPANLIGGIASVTFTREAEGEDVKITDDSFIPVVTHYSASYRGLSLYPLSDYSDALAQSHGIRTWRGYDFSIEYIEKLLGGIGLYPQK